MTDEKQAAAIKQRAAEIEADMRSEFYPDQKEEVIAGLERALREGMAMQMPEGFTAVKGDSGVSPPLPRMSFVSGVDMPDQFVSRDWLESALRDKGAKIIGKGWGSGGAEVAVSIHGDKYTVTISRDAAMLARNGE